MRISSLFRLVGSISLAFAFGVAAAQPQYPTVKLRMGHFVPATFSQADVDQWFADEVRRRTNGAVDIEIFWAGSMGGPSELLSLVSSGALDFGAFPIAYYPRQFPLTGVGTLPRVFSDVGTAHAAVSKLFELPEIRAEHKKNNVTALMTHFTNEYRLACNKSVESMSSVRGYKVRSFGEFTPIMLRAVEMVPVNTAAGEVYEALSKGNLNCSMLSYDQVLASKIYEVAKHASTVNFGSLMSWQIWMNNDRMSALPQSVKDVLIAVGKEAMTRDVETARNALAKALPGLEEKGVKLFQMTDATEFETKMPSALNLWAKKQNDAGLGKPVASIMAIVEPMARAFK